MTFGASDAKAHLIGLWKFQPEEAPGGAAFATDAGQNAPFHLSEGTIAARFTQTQHADAAPAAIILHGGSGDAGSQTMFALRVTNDGGVAVEHHDGADSVRLRTEGGFFDEGDTIEARYAWSPTAGVVLEVENLSQGTSATVADASATGLTMDVTDSDDTGWTFADGAQGNDTNSVQVQGALDHVAVYDKDLVSQTPDGVVEGTEGSDLIDIAYTGDPDGDMIDAGDAPDGSNDDVVVAGGGDDTVLAGQGDDSVLGGDGNDLIFGETGHDSLSGNAGDDVIVGDGGQPVEIKVTGSEARFDNGLFAYTIDPGTGEVSNRQLLTENVKDNIGDTFTYHAAPGAVVGLGIISPEGEFLSSGHGANIGLNPDGKLHTELRSAEPDGTASFGFEDLFDLGDGDFNDVIVTVDLNGSGTSFDNAHLAMDSDLTETALDGDDVIDGGAGDDVLFGLGGDDVLVGGAGADVLSGGSGNDALVGLDGDDVLIGGPGADVMSGGSDRDTFLGADADDVIAGGSGGEDFDTLDLTGQGPFVLRDVVTDSDGNGVDGRVAFLDAAGAVTGSAVFTNIERIIPCFTPGTAIATPQGERAVETLQVGDRVITRDNGLQAIRWVGRRDLSAKEVACAPHLRPVLIRAGALGNGLPECDMLVSPQHRVLLMHERAALYFEEREVLAAARHLTDMDGIAQVPAGAVSYVHFMCDRHEVVLSNGAWTESFQPGEQIMDAMGARQRDEIHALFPELRERAGLAAYQAARRTLKRHEARLLIAG